MILVVAEKPRPTVNHKVIGASSRKGRIWRDYIVSGVGHLVGLADAAAYDERYAKWR